MKNIVLVLLIASLLAGCENGQSESAPSESIISQSNETERTISSEPDLSELAGTYTYTEPGDFYWYKVVIPSSGTMVKFYGGQPMDGEWKKECEMNFDQKNKYNDPYDGHVVIAYTRSDENQKCDVLLAGAINLVYDAKYKNLWFNLAGKRVPFNPRNTKLNPWQ